MNLGETSWLTHYKYSFIGNFRCKICWWEQKTVRWISYDCLFSNASCNRTRSKIISSCGDPAHLHRDPPCDEIYWMYSRQQMTSLSWSQPAGQRCMILQATTGSMVAVKVNYIQQYWSDQCRATEASDTTRHDNLRTFMHALSIERRRLYSEYQRSEIRPTSIKQKIFAARASLLIRKSDNEIQKARSSDEARKESHSHSQYFRVNV